ncbi:rRNA-processing protein UTP23 homolog isoform X1 [Juglans microcarpa x Juglans regia]|uniref:rRNA-processing protein UTP23 homolog isoform X1 n=1 Tax=Juglans microcarpa x Juglans regia TaxID=2249226 RepID=UPI001B7EF0E0|nr:rRNA-processing protein UTP23 homolog isoform X1 [Juglans microcarpa x Juglans regia]XP_041006967.1 rRNA-processing protein UTP23 homolog isoform X1 [Juglans microcarpa x Juglans regia]XP_041006968.1 rRNA-processing protein UTP23 homolog isoform X1 [Juglans microcarpa x Juglans regia]
MRVKRQKCHRKSVRFYTSCFGFRQPFKVLCDGTFVHHLIANTIKPADTAISNILSAAPVKLLTTRCVLAELKRLGTSYFQALEAAHQLFTVSCNHEKNKSADACIKDVIGQNNPEHFFVATQDTDLRKKFQEIPGVPIIFGLRNSLFLEPPSAFQRQFVKTSEEARLHMTELDRKMLQKRSRNRSVDEEANNSSGENEDFVDQKIGIQDERKPPTALKAMSVKDRVQFKRKKAKGPNPLSCRKKSHEKPKLVLEKEKKDSENSARSRSRKRKRSRGDKKIAEKDG